jgi:hypothetical protein
MKSGERILEKEDRINNRIFILSNIEHMIKESVYYRTYSQEIQDCNKIASVVLSDSEMKAKLI